MPTLEDFQNMLGQVEQEKVQQSTLYRKAVEAQAAEEQKQQEQEQKMGQFFRNVFDDAAKIQRIRQYEAGFRNLAARQQQQQADNMGIMPLVKAYGGYVRRFDDGGRVTQEDLDRNGWRWAGIDELQDLDPLYKTIDPTESEWLVDSSGRLVPKSTVENWLNSYERQTPWQAQNDIAADEWLRQRMADRFVSTLGITDWTKPQQRQNFWDAVTYTAEGAMGALGTAMLAPILLPTAAGGLPMAESTAAALGLGSDLLTGLAIGKGVDAASTALTGNSWGANINNLLGIDRGSGFGHLTNPGYFASARSLTKPASELAAQWAARPKLDYTTSGIFPESMRATMGRWYDPVNNALDQAITDMAMNKEVVFPTEVRDFMNSPEFMNLDEATRTFISDMTQTASSSAAPAATGAQRVGQAAAAATRQPVVAYQPPVTRPTVQAQQPVRQSVSTPVQQQPKPMYTPEQMDSFGLLSLEGLNPGQLRRIPYDWAAKHPDMLTELVMDGIATSVHPNLQAGISRREMANALVQMKSDIANRPKYGIFEESGFDFSGDSFPLILDRLMKKQAELVAAGEMPGIVSYKGGKVKLNSFGNINYGTKEAPSNPFMTLEKGRYHNDFEVPGHPGYTLEEMSGWRTIQEAVDALNTRLQQFYDINAPYNERMRNTKKEDFKAEVDPITNRIVVPRFQIMFKDGGGLF